MFNKIIILLMLISLQFSWLAAFNLSITPDRVHVGEGPSTVTVLCSSDLALTACQFTWRDHESKAGPLLELSRGPQSQANSSHLDDKVTGYRYSGRGLGEGDCGVDLQLKGLKIWMLGCRVRAENGGWQYNWIDLHAANWPHLPTNVTTPKEVIVLPGGKVRLVVKAQVPLKKCNYRLPAWFGGIEFYLVGAAGELDFDQGTQSHNSTGRHYYYGAGLQSGECGLALSKVSEADNGPTTCFVESQRTSSRDRRFLPVIVARQPSEPVLNVSYYGTTLTATCTVLESRPVAQISWLVGDGMVRVDSVDDSTVSHQDVWRWPWVSGPITQILRLALQPQNHGESIKCLVSHVTLAAPLVASQKILFPTVV